MSKSKTSLQILPPQISLKIIETKLLDWKLIEDFQPNGFKSGSTEGLKKSILENNLIDRFKVFKLPKDKMYYMFDGHTRRSLMLSMEKNSEAEFPDKLECDVLEFSNKKEAALALLKYQSGKLKVTEKGINEFAEVLSIDNSEFDEIINDFGIDIIPEFRQYDDDDDDDTGNDQDKIEAAKYTRNIETPIYSPSNEKPKIKDLIDTTKRDSLIKKIKESDIEKEVKEFLIHAASRHTIFNYTKIADYYAHSDKNIQELMQDSVLVIIDFNKALNDGFIKLTNDIALISGENN